MRLIYRFKNTLKLGWELYKDSYKPLIGISYKRFCVERIHFSMSFKTLITPLRVS